VAAIPNRSVANDIIATANTRPIIIVCIYCHNNCENVLYIKFQYVN
jgi:hypothetical protein